MALSFVRELASGIRTTATVNTIVLTPTANTAAGDLLVLGCSASGSQTISTVTDTKSNTWTVGPSPGATNSNAQAAWTLQNGGALTTLDTVTVTFSSTSSHKAAILLEFSGAAASPHDVDGTHVGVGPTVTTSSPITNGNDLVIAVCAWKDTTLQDTFTAGAGYTAFEIDENGGANLGVAVEYQILSGHSLSTVTANGTMSGSPGNGSQLVMTFLPGSTSVNINLPTATATASASPSKEAVSGPGIQYIGPLAQAKSAVNSPTFTFSPTRDVLPSDWVVLATNHSIASVTDTKSNTWTVGPDPGSSGQNVNAAWTSQNAGTLTASDVITVTYNFTTPNKVLVALEFSNVGLIEPDASGTSTATSGSTLAATTSGAITNANDLLLGAFAWKGASQLSFTPTGGSIVTFDNATQGSAGGLTFLHTTSGSNRYLTVGVSIWGGTSISATGITYAGTAMTRLNRSVGTVNTTELWGLVNPAVGSNSIAVTLSGSTTSVQVGAASFTNANQVTQNGDTGGSSGPGSPLTSAALTGPIGGMLVDMVDEGGAITVSTGTQAWNDGGGDAQAYLQTTGVPQSTSWTSGVTAPWTMSAGVILPSAATSIEMDEGSGLFTGVAMSLQILQAASLTTKTLQGTLNGTLTSGSSLALALSPTSTTVNIALPTATATAAASPLIVDPTGTSWQNIGGATSATYTPINPDDTGNQLRCLITGTNSAGNAVVASSATNAVATALIRPTTGSPTIDDTTPQVSEVLNALPNVNTWDGTPPLTFAYQWQHSGTTSTATSQVFVCLDGEIHIYDPQNNWTQVASYTGLATSDGIRGVTADPHAGAAGRIYIGHGSDGGPPGTGSLMCWDIATHSVVYDVGYAHGVDQIAITLDGTQVWMPDGEGHNASTNWFVKTASTGAAVATVNVSGAAGPHNTATGLKSGNLYLGSRHAHQIDIYTQARAFVKSINTGNPGGSLSGNVGARPYTFDSNETLLFVTQSDFLGFTVIDLATGSTIFTVDLTTAPYGSFPFNSGTSNFTTPCHGISMTPDETQLAVIDVFNSRVHFFDITGLMASRTAPVRLSSPFIDGATSNRQFTGTQTPCAYDCQRYGWLTHSWDGRYLYVQDTADVFDTVTRQKVGTIATMRNTRHGTIEMVSVNGASNFTPTHFGLGRKSFGQIPQSSTLGWSNASGTGNATSAYTVNSTDNTLQLRCAVTGTNSLGSATVDTPATSPVTAASAPTAGSPTIDNTTPFVGDTLTALANAGTWDGTPPLTFTYNWQHLLVTGTWANATGAGHNTLAYLVDATDSGLALRCLIVATNNVGSSRAVPTTVTQTVGDQLTPPGNTTPPSLILPQATPSVGDILICAPGVWTGSPAPDISFQWRHSPDGTTFSNCSGVGSGTSNYTVDTSDVGLNLSCLVTASNTVGTANTQTAATPSTVSPTQATATTLIDIFLSTGGVTPPSQAATSIDVFLSTGQPPIPTPVTGSDNIVVNLSTPIPVTGDATILSQRPRFLRHCGTEVSNMARTYHYLKNGLAGPLFDVSGSEPCAVLFREASASVFNAPAQDPAPWYDPNRPESAKFLGLILQTLEVLDSTHSRPATNVMGRLGGAVFSSTRRTGRFIYGTGSLIAQDAEGSDYGLQWLKAVLEGSGCDDCATCVSEVRLSCPPEDGSDDTRGWWRLYNTVLVDGPKKSQTYDYDCAFLLDVEFTLEAGNPYLFKGVRECLAATELLPDPGVQACTPFDEWLCGPGSAVQCCTIAPPTEVGTTCGIVTIESRLGVGGILIAAYNDCPPVPGISVPVAQMIIPELPAGSSLVVDSGLHQVSYISPSGVISDGTPYISLPSGSAMGWVEVSDCDPATCLCVQTLHPCSGGIETFVTIQSTYREA